MNDLVLGYKVSTSNSDELVQEMFARVQRGRGGELVRSWFACLNPHSYAIAKNDQFFSEALKGTDWLVADGVGVVLASRVLGARVKSRVTGSDIFFGLNTILNESGGASVFFLGATEETLAEIARRMAVDYPNIRLAGVYSPPFKSYYSEEDSQRMISAINNADADVLWVGLTAPKQEKWIYQNIDRLNIHFAGAIGAVFDFYTGNVLRSHPIFQRLGFEWLPRLVQQPRRLWRRMFISAPIFVWDVFLKKLGF